MQTFTRLDNWEMFLDVLQVQSASEEKFEYLFETQKEVRELTGFSSWLEMKDKAEEIYYECIHLGSNLRIKGA
ncbi:hypothetical protein [Halalkalibacter alkalisediminis]|uniref:Uncharacterized protein n=1 Tax=Halalkalibacter alkalisediminis TaxID=935616 RepID=A0ABV6NDD1_9BACI|nr:hypothetical protein [Halalkalibacter alkalisediminis]